MSRTTSLGAVPWSEALGTLREGSVVYVAGATGEPQGLPDALRTQPGVAAGVTFLGSCVPGMNVFDYAGVHAQARLQTFFANPVAAESMRQGRVTVLPLPYSRAQRYLLQRRDIECAILHLSSPNSSGECSLGLAAEFTPTAMRVASRRCGVINTNMPFLPGALAVKLRDLQMIVEDDTPPLTMQAAQRSSTTSAIGKQIASLIPDGATLQLGIGAVPATVYDSLAGHKQLSFHSGLLTDGALDLDSAGALSHSRSHVTGAVVGERRLYEGIVEIANLSVAGVEFTHDIVRLAAIPHFVSINSALEVDLFGQVNLEAVDGRLVSGIGGALDFIRGAQLSPGGISIIALPATARSATVSRIVPRLGASSPVSIGRGDIDHVVTEFGSAALAGRGVDARAEALIQIAAPAFRDSLSEEWIAMRRLW